MWKKYKKEFFASMVVILLPIIVGLIFWNRLPEMIPTHFGLDNQPNGWSPKWLAVFGIPVFLALLQCILMAATNADPKRKNIPSIPFKIVLWIIPVCSWLCTVLCFAYAMGLPMNVRLLVCIFLGIVFIVLGIYLPKCGPNYTFGIRCPWTLEDPDNWVHTHRFAGYVFVAGGILILLLGFCGTGWSVLPIILLIVLLPFLYAFIYSRRHPRQEEKRD